MKEINSYIDKSDWRINENANTGFSISGLKSYISSTILAKDSLSRLPRNIRDAHKNGEIHIHDLDGSLWSPYCLGADLQQLMFEGLKNPVGSMSNPAKYLDTMTDHMVNYLYMSQNEFNGAQAFSNVDTLLSGYVIGQDYSYIKQCLQRLIYNISYPLRSAFQCISEDTQILTNTGWKYYNEISEIDKVGTFNLVNNELEFLIPDKIVRYNYNGKMIHIANMRTDQLVTPEHRIIKTETENLSQKWMFIEAKELLEKKIFCLPITTQYNIKDYNITDNELKLHAWIISEGTYRSGNSFRIYQSTKSIFLDEIRNLLKVNNIDFFETSQKSGFGGKDVVIFNCSKKRNIEFNIIKEIPNTFLLLSRKQAKLFLDEYRKGDGSNNKYQYRIYSKNKNNIEMIEALCVISGYGFHTIYHKQNGVASIRLIKYFKNKTYIYKNRNNAIEAIDYNGLVWCVRSKNESMITKRNGKIAITGNTPFINFSFDLIPPKHMKNEPVLIAGKTHESLSYGDMQKEMDMINKAFLEIMLKGDSQGKPFTFPIPTYGITKELLNKNDEVTNLLWQLSTKFGNPNFMNYIATNADPSDVRALCCRLNLDISKLRGRGLWNIGNKTGSLGVVTLNFNHASKDGEDHFIELIDDYYDLAIQELLIKRKYIYEAFNKGLLPFTRCYLPEKDPFATFFNTIGIHAMNEACINMFGETIEFHQDFVVEILKHLRNRVDETTEETGILHNIEQTPCEGATHRLAKLDKKFGLPTQGTNNPFLTNSTHCPVNTIFDWTATVKVQEKFNTYYSGGTIMHGFTGEDILPERAEKIIKQMSKETTIPYYNLTPTYSICQDHGRFAGNVPICPTCNNMNYVYSRVVGYLQPVQKWNKGKQEEFRMRKEYKI